MKEANNVKLTQERVRETVILCQLYKTDNGPLPPRCEDALNHMSLKSLKLESKPRTWIGRQLLSNRIRWIEKFDEEIRREISPFIKS